MSEPEAKALARKRQIEQTIERAQRTLEEAARLASPLGGYCDQWEDISRTTDAVESLWWRIHQGPLPGRHDHEDGKEAA